MYEENCTALSGIDCSFGNYLARRKMMEAKRMDGNGIPNYAFALDYQTRKKLDAVPGLYNTAKTFYSTTVPRQIQMYNRNALAVGPDQFPEIYALVTDCARKLGIAIPNVYIINTTEMNAAAYASDDVEPLIIIYNGLRERMTLGELKFIIGHECGHIQNYHVLYQTIVAGFVSAGIATAESVSLQLAQLAFKGCTVALNTWSRAAEVTADRAGMICADSLEDCVNAIAKLMYGGTISQQDEINYKSIMSQLHMAMGNISRYEELFSSHPSSARRLAVMQEFSQCETFYEWRPDLKSPGITTRSKAETDDRCNRFIDLTQKG